MWRVGPLRTAVALLAACAAAAPLRSAGRQADVVHPPAAFATEAREVASVPAAPPAPAMQPTPAAGERGAAPQAPPGSKTVMLWNTYFKDPHWYIKELGGAPFASCRERRCSLSTHQASPDGFDAVLIHGRDDALPMPPRKPAEQVRAFVLIEPPEHVNPKDVATIAQGVHGVNWTVTYRRDSDVVLPYGYLLQSDVHNGTHSSATVKSKLTLAARPRAQAVWIASDCQSEDERQLVVEALKDEGLEVDTYGGCGTPHPCPMHDKECNIAFMSRYDFVLAFETSRCRDYVTEKFWNALLSEAVPVVMGPRRSDFEAVGPPSSFLHMDDFKGDIPKAASMLKKLASDRVHTRATYKAWRASKAVQVGGLHDPRWMCDLCEKLHAPRAKAPRAALDKAGLLQFLYGDKNSAVCSADDEERDVFMWKDWQNVAAR